MRPLLLVLDVDGVTRQGVTDIAHPDVVRGVKTILSLAKQRNSLTKKRPVHVAFISGTTCVSEHFEDRSSNRWREMNVDLRTVFAGFFDEEILAGTVSVRGLVGASLLIPRSPTMQRSTDEEMGESASTSSLTTTSSPFTHTMERGFLPTVAMALAVQMVKIYIEDLERVVGVPSAHKATSMLAEVESKVHRYAKVWESEMIPKADGDGTTDTSSLTNQDEDADGNSSVPSFLETTPDCFQDLMLYLQQEAQDPELKLIVNSNRQTRLTGTVEFHDFGICHSDRSIATSDVVDQATALCIPLDPTPMTVAGGLAHREGRSFRFVIAAKSDKGIAIKSIVDGAENTVSSGRSQLPTTTPSSSSSSDVALSPLIVTVGDTGIDVPMHRKATAAFHVGKRVVLEKHSAEIPALRMIEAKGGSAEERDSQHITGTCVVLDALTQVLLEEGSKGDSEAVVSSVESDYCSSFITRLWKNCETDGHRLI